MKALALAVAALAAAAFQTSTPPVDPMPVLAASGGGSGVQPRAALGSTCVKTADCASASLFCEYRTSGCRGATGRCASTSCQNDPMNFTFCGCDGKTKDTGSMCMPGRPYSALAPCPTTP